MPCFIVHVSTQYGKEHSTKLLHLNVFLRRSQQWFYIMKIVAIFIITNLIWMLLIHCLHKQLGQREDTTVPREQAGSNEYESFTVIFCFSMRWIVIYETDCTGCSHPQSCEAWCTHSVLLLQSNASCKRSQLRKSISKYQNCYTH